MNVKNYCLAVLFLGTSSFQYLTAQQPRNEGLSDISLKVSSTSGTNGVAVAYNPTMHLYYTVFAGNASYDIEVFDGKGFSVFKKEIGGDVRGMWFNSAKNQLEGILYNNEGSYTIPLDSKGYPGKMQLTPFAYQMAEQDVATSSGKKVYFIDADGFHSFKFGKKKRKTVYFKDKMIYLDTYNLNGPVYTGVSGYEMGLYNFNENILDLFSEKSGSMTASVKLKLDDVINYPGMFRVSFCNGHLFLFDTESRTWIGFKIF